VLGGMEGLSLFFRRNNLHNIGMLFPGISSKVNPDPLLCRA
jgi:hypothetical protein